MKFDKGKGYTITLEEWLKCGYTERQYNYLRKKGLLKTANKPAKGHPVEIILSSVPEDKRQRIIEHLGLSEDEQRQALVEANETNIVSDIAIHNTAKSIELNAEYIRNELRVKIEKDFGKYLQYYFGYEISKQSVIEYAKLCVVIEWLYERVQVIRNVSETKRELRRYMRSLMANFLEVRRDIGIKSYIPSNERIFMAWLGDKIAQIDKGKKVEEVVRVKRAGNSNRQKFTEEQKLVAERLYINGNLSDRQVYDRLLDIGKEQRWWMEEGEYKPITYRTLNLWLNENRDRLEMKRSDRIGFYTNVVPTIDRKYPKEKNYIWGIDGTAHNEHTRIGNSVRQYTYTVYVYDYATMYLLSIGVSRREEGESGKLLIETLKEAIRRAGYKPYILQYDRGPGSKELDDFCRQNGIKAMPTQIGIARSKLVEQLLGQMQRQIINALQGWNGQNRTAHSRNSTPSSEFWSKGITNARTYNQIKEWLQTEAIELWNNHVIERMEGEPLGKTPQQMWEDLPSKVDKLDYATMLYIAGKLHKIKKTVKGIELQYNKQIYRYIPDIRDAEKAAEIWLSINNGSKVDVYVGEYGEPVAVWQDNRYLGLWIMKERVSMVSTFDGETEEYIRQRRFQKEVERQAKEKIEEHRRQYEQLSYFEEVENKVKLILPESRSRIEKKYKNEQEDIEKYEEMELVDPDTGEIRKYKRRLTIGAQKMDRNNC